MQTGNPKSIVREMKNSNCMQTAIELLRKKTIEKKRKRKIIKKIMSKNVGGCRQMSRIVEKRLSKKKKI